MAWSPVATPVQRERSVHERGDDAQHPRPAGDANVEAAPGRARVDGAPDEPVRVGRQQRVGVQEQQHVAARPAPRRRSSAGPGRAARSAPDRRAGARSAAVASVLPPSATITSTPRARSGASACRVVIDGRGLVQRRHDDGQGRRHRGSPRTSFSAQS